MATIDDRAGMADRRKTTVEWVALVVGAGFLLVGILGFFVTGMNNMESDPDVAPKLLGIFPVNVLHNVVHILFGVWGIAASRSWSASKTFGQIGGVAYLLLAVLGLIARSTFGLIPIGGNNIWLHALLGVVLAYFGFTARDAAIRPATGAAV
jgi:hypothetical protein